MVNDSKILPPQFMFLLAGSLFIVGSIIMYAIRVLCRRDVNKNSNISPANNNSIDQKEIDVEHQATIDTN